MARLHATIGEVPSLGEGDQTIGSEAPGLAATVLPHALVPGLHPDTS